MAEALIAQYGAEVPRRLAAELAAVVPGLSEQRFLQDALAGYEALPLMARGRHLAEVMACHLPQDGLLALRLMLASLGPPRPTRGIEAFYWLPHGLFAAKLGARHFDAAMAALETLTQRFSAEFAIRPLLDQDPAAAAAWLRRWSIHESAAVRRLVSEGTRPRLPWAARLQRFRADPALLLALRDDPDEAVRRSVANHLNDLGREDSAQLLAIASDWLTDAPAPRVALLRHALRSRLKAGDPAALALFGQAQAPLLRVEDFALQPKRPRIGETLELRLLLRSLADAPQDLRADLCVDFLKADGRWRTKVFRLSSFSLEAGAVLPLRKRIQLADLTTRKHYPGAHGLSLQINGQRLPLPGFELLR